MICLSMFVIGAGFLSCRQFHAPNAWISRSPTNSQWAVDLVPSGFLDIGHDFRVHDRFASPLQPRYVCDLFWQQRYYPTDLHWSRDGSVAAIRVSFSTHTDSLFACAYDFRQHRSFRTGSPGSPLEPSPDFATKIEKLLAERGGVGSVIPVPDVNKGP